MVLSQPIAKGSSQTPALIISLVITPASYGGEHQSVNPSMEEHQSVNPSMEVLLPDDVMIDILSRLPVKTIINSKRVCKKWRNFVLESSFVNLHLSKSPTALMIHHNPYINMPEYESYDFKLPGIFKLLEIEDRADHHHLHYDDPIMTLDLNLAPIFQDSQTQIVGSVNGLICLWQYYPKLDNTYICNPITKEYMILPRQEYYRQGYAIIVYGFGVSSLTGEYKVVRTFQGDIPPNGYKSSRPSLLEAEVYTLGTGQWRSLGSVPYWLNGFCGPFLNDHCHWIVCDKEDDAPEKLCTFDLNKETFRLFPSPPIEAIQESRFHHQSLAVLKGCLCKLDTYDSKFTIWVMKEYGIKKSWHKEVVITQAIRFDLDWPFWETMSLIEGLKDGSFLMFYGDNELWAYYPQTKTIEDTKIFGCYTSGLAYRPSFLKLQTFESERVHMF